MDLHVFPIPIPSPTSLCTHSLWVFPVHQAGALVSCIQPGLVIFCLFEELLLSFISSLIFLLVNFYFYLSFPLFSLILLYFFSNFLSCMLIHCFLD